MTGFGQHRGNDLGSFLNDPDFGHCCFAGCTMVNCPRCGESHCVRLMHICPYRGRHRKEDQGEPHLHLDRLRT